MEISCPEAKKVIDEAFAGGGNPYSKPIKGKALGRVLYEHLTDQEAMKKLMEEEAKEAHKVKCRGCWEHYEAAKRQYCGG